MIKPAKNSPRWVVILWKTMQILLLLLTTVEGYIIFGTDYKTTFGIAVFAFMCFACGTYALQWLEALLKTLGRLYDRLH